MAWQPFDIPPDNTKSGMFVGTSGYHYDDWIGVFNPRRPWAQQVSTMADDQKADLDPLRFYQKHFSFVEINDTFYTEPTLPHFLDIQARSKESMLYSVKVHKNISDTRECETSLGQDMMRRHITAVSLLIESGQFVMTRHTSEILLSFGVFRKRGFCFGANFAVY